MNQFGGSWTERKMEIVVSYAKAYLTIMRKQSWVKTIYFDGFAGSGMIEAEEKEESIKGTALRILEIEHANTFDLYYFVELNEKYAGELKSRVNQSPLKPKIKIVNADCNSKLLALATFMKDHKNFRALAFVDPYGMSVNWSSIEALKGLGIDLWILVPTGIGVNRLLKGDGKIPEVWLEKLEKVLGINRLDIRKTFYKENTFSNLFGEEQTEQFKDSNAITKIHNLYSQRLKTVFKEVSEPFVLRNSQNSIMYHFMLATNNKAGLKIANDLIKPNYKL